MATTITPIVSTGTLFKIKTTGTTYVTIKGVTDFSGLGGGSATIIDVSDLSSTSKEKLQGISDEGSVKVSLNYIPDDPGQVALEAARASGAKTGFQNVLPDGTTYTYDGFAQSFDKSWGVDKQITASAAIEITGSVVKTKAP